MLLTPNAPRKRRAPQTTHQALYNSHVRFTRLLDGMPVISTLPPVALLAECSKIQFHRGTFVGEGYDVVDVKDGPRIDCRRPTAENAPELVPRKHTESQFQRNGSIPFNWKLHRWPGRRFNGRRLEVDVPADERCAGIHPSAKPLLVRWCRSTPRPMPPTQASRVDARARSRPLRVPRGVEHW